MKSSIIPEFKFRPCCDLVPSASFSPDYDCFRNAPRFTRRRAAGVTTFLTERLRVQLCPASQRRAGASAWRSRIPAAAVSLRPTRPCRVFGAPLVEAGVRHAVLTTPTCNRDTGLCLTQYGDDLFFCVTLPLAGGTHLNLFSDFLGPSHNSRLRFHTDTPESLWTINQLATSPMFV